MRLYGISQSDVHALVVPENQAREDLDGNLLFIGLIGGLPFCAVLARDDLSTVITVYDLEA